MRHVRHRSIRIAARRLPAKERRRPCNHVLCDVPAHHVPRASLLDSRATFHGVSGGALPTSPRSTRSVRLEAGAGPRRLGSSGTHGPHWQAAWPAGPRCRAPRTHPRCRRARHESSAPSSVRRVWRGVAKSLIIQHCTYVYLDIDVYIYLSLNVTCPYVYIYTGLRKPHKHKDPTSEADSFRDFRYDL